ncbi:MAG TPA: glycosyl hydrolase family 28-related protein, partial [Candidatus Dormibacteraeota bacterium]|nr:glycosyl hydrolase family 28-related protein [Candidatus Dormibacteraeota bacterium]
STAGYHGGGVSLPEIPVKTVVHPSGGSDDTAVIQNAIDDVAALPEQNGFRGAVLLGPGTFTCSNAIVIPTNGIVLRGSGAKRTTIQMTGSRHVAIRAGMGGRNRRPERNGERDPNEDFPETNNLSIVQTTIADAYVPAGTRTFSITDVQGFTEGDVIEIRRPVTEAWVKFMGMDNLTRNGRPQTWIRTGTILPIERRIAAISGNTIMVDVPLSDSLNPDYQNDIMVVKIDPPKRLTEVGIEDLHIQSPPQRVNHTQELYTAIRLSGEDCWIRDVVIDETMNSVGLGGRRITVQNVSVNRKALHLGASKPAEFAPNGDQILLDRCSVNADNVWFAATGAG